MNKRKTKRKLKPQVRILIGIIGIGLIIGAFDLIESTYRSVKNINIDNRKVVVIDMGHGGKDQGTQSLNKKIIEKDITLNIGNKVIDKLKNDENIKVVATRDSDEFISLQERNKIAEQNDAELFISIHANASGDSLQSAQGIETFYWSDDDDSYKVAQLIHDNMIKNTKAYDRGIKKGNYQVLRDANYPAILIETGFLTNYLESINLSNNNYQSQIANAIVYGIKEYFKEK